MIPVVFQTQNIMGKGWKVLEVRHLEGSENNYRRHVFVDVVDEQGKDLRQTGLQLRYGWEGMNAEEAPAPIPLDKSTGDGAAGNFALFRGMKAWVELVGQDYPSERVGGFTADLPPDSIGNEWGMHSYYVKFGLSD
jgi:hypothetical protein